MYAAVGIARGQIWRSDNGGQSYKLRFVAGPRDTVIRDPNYANAIWAGDPTNADLVIVGGQNLWRSTQGGAALRKISRWDFDASVHGDQHVIVLDTYHSGDSRAAFVGTDGGVYWTKDIATVGSHPPFTGGWERRDQGLSSTQFYSGAGIARAGILIGGAQDNGTLQMRPNKSDAAWSTTQSGDGGAAAADPDSAYLFGEYTYLTIHRTNPSGDSTEWIDGEYPGPSKTEWKSPPFRIPDAGERTLANFIAPFALDPNDHKRMFAGGVNLWRSRNVRARHAPGNLGQGGPQWERVKRSIPLNTRADPYDINGSEGRKISAIAIAPGDADLAYVCYNSGKISQTHDATSADPHWKDMVLPDSPNRVCTHITINPSDHSTVYVTFGGWQRPNVLRTTDGGANWEWKGVELPEAPIWSLALHPDNPRLVYVGTEVGVFGSDDGGNNWKLATDQGPLAVSVQDLFWMKDTLVAATHGRGMFKIHLPTTTEIVEARTHETKGHEAKKGKGARSE